MGHFKTEVRKVHDAVFVVDLTSKAVWIIPILKYKTKLYISDMIHIVSSATTIISNFRYPFLYFHF